jgi:hypothetical protein
MTRRTKRLFYEGDLQNRSSELPWERGRFVGASSTVRWSSFWDFLFPLFFTPRPRKLADSRGRTAQMWWGPDLYTSWWVLVGWICGLAGKDGSEGHVVVVDHAAPRMSQRSERSVLSWKRRQCYLRLEILCCVRTSIVCKSEETMPFSATLDTAFRIHSSQWLQPTPLFSSHASWPRARICEVWLLHPESIAQELWRFHAPSTTSPSSFVWEPGPFINDSSWLHWISIWRLISSPLT